MKYTSIDNTLFIQNRKRFTTHLKAKSIAVFNSNDIMPTNADGSMPFRQNNDLFYLSGVDQEESVLVIFPDANDEKHREILFVKETNDEIAIWEGAKLTQEEATKTSGIKTVYWTSEFNEVFQSLIADADNLYLNKNEHSRASTPVETRDDRYRKQYEEKYSSSHQFERLAPIMANLRAIKSPIEIDLIQQACDITKKGVTRVLKFVKPGVMEYEIEAELIHEFLKNRSKGFAYEPIVASGFNACVLHYLDNNKECKAGDVILIDVGAEYANYASDLTRSIPVSGRFTPRQKEVYNAVLRVTKEATSMLVPGTLHEEYHTEVGKIMTSELIGLGLLNKHDVANQDKKNPLYRKYFMHGTSHHIGLDVHDVEDRSRPFEAGMVLTVEPGIYIREENLGIRLENDILITNNGPDDLMKNIPIEAEEIEDLMNS